MLAFAAEAENSYNTPFTHMAFFAFIHKSRDGASPSGLRWNFTWSSGLVFVTSFDSRSCGFIAKWVGVTPSGTNSTFCGTNAWGWFVSLVVLRLTCWWKDYNISVGQTDAIAQNAVMPLLTHLPPSSTWSHSKKLRNFLKKNTEKKTNKHPKRLFLHLSFTSDFHEWSENEN